MHEIIQLKSKLRKRNRYYIENKNTNPSGDVEITINDVFNNVMGKALLSLKK